MLKGLVNDPARVTPEAGAAQDRLFQRRRPRPRAFVPRRCTSARQSTRCVLAHVRAPARWCCGVTAAAACPQTRTGLRRCDEALEAQKIVYAGGGHCSSSGTDGQGRQAFLRRSCPPLSGPVNERRRRSLSGSVLVTSVLIHFAVRSARASATVPPFSSAAGAGYGGRSPGAGAAVVKDGPAACGSTTTTRTDGSLVDGEAAAASSSPDTSCSGCWWSCCRAGTDSSRRSCRRPEPIVSGDDGAGGSGRRSRARSSSCPSCPRCRDARSSRANNAAARTSPDCVSRLDQRRRAVCCPRHRLGSTTFALAVPLVEFRAAAANPSLLLSRGAEGAAEVGDSSRPRSARCWPSRLASSELSVAVARCRSARQDSSSPRLIEPEPWPTDGRAAAAARRAWRCWGWSWIELLLPDVVGSSSVTRGGGRLRRQPRR